MAKPDCDDGFLMLAIELFAVLASYGLRDREWKVLAWVLIQVYGPHKRRSVHLDYREIGDYTALDPGNARRGANELVARGILTIDPTDRSATFSKYFLRWADPPSEDSIRFGQAAVARFGTARKRKTGKVQRDVPDKSRTVQRDCPHIEERAAEDLESGEKRENSKTTPYPLAGVVEGEAGGGAVDLAGLQAWSDTLGPTQDLPPVVLAWSRSYPLEWIESALVCGLVSAPNRIAQYANGCLARWKSRGGPPHAEVAAAVDQATASQAESFYDRQARERREQIARLVAQEATDGR